MWGEVEPDAGAGNQHCWKFSGSGAKEKEKWRSEANLTAVKIVPSGATMAHFWLLDQSDWAAPIPTNHVILKGPELFSFAKFERAVHYPVIKNRSPSSYCIIFRLFLQQFKFIRVRCDQMCVNPVLCSCKKLR